jgi:hypothetical protein
MYTPKVEFHPGEAVCVYVEALNVNHGGRMDVTFSVWLSGPGGITAASQSNRFTANITDPSCDYHWNQLPLSLSSPPGAYVAQVDIRDNLTAQTDRVTTLFTVVSFAEASAKSNTRTPAMEVVNAKLFSVIKSQARLIGEVKTENFQTWPVTLDVSAVDETSGQFNGRIEWTTLNAMTGIEGALSGGALTFRETKYIQQSNVALGTFKLRLVEPDKLEGSWSNEGGLGTASFRIPVSLPSSTADSRTDSSGPTTDKFKDSSLISQAEDLYQNRKYDQALKVCEQIRIQDPANQAVAKLKLKILETKRILALP